MHTSANLVLLGAVDQGFWATMIKHAIYRIILSADKRYLNRMRYVEPEVKCFENHMSEVMLALSSIISYEYWI